MLTNKTSLFEAQDIRLGPIDHEKDPEVESKWTHDSEFMRLMELKSGRPLAPAMVKKGYESLEKGIVEDKNLFYFTIRAREDDRLLGKVMLECIDWSNGNGYLSLGIGASQDRGRGLGTQALSLVLRFAFAELNRFPRDGRHSGIRPGGHRLGPQVWLCGRNLPSQGYLTRRSGIRSVGLRPVTF